MLFNLKKLTKLKIDPKLLSNIIYKRLILISMSDFIFPSKNFEIQLNYHNLALILLLISK